MIIVVMYSMVIVVFSMGVKVTPSLLGCLDQVVWRLEVILEPVAIGGPCFGGLYGKLHAVARILDEISSVTCHMSVPEAWTCHQSGHKTQNR